MPISSGAHGWSIEYLNRPPRPRKPPDDDYHTTQIPHSHRRSKSEPGYTVEDSPAVRRVGPPPRRRQRVFPANRTDNPQTINSIDSDDEKNPSKTINDIPYKPSQRQEYPNNIRRNLNRSNSVERRNEGESTESDNNGNAKTIATDSSPVVRGRAPAPRKLVYPVSKYKEVKVLQKEKNEDSNSTSGEGDEAMHAYKTSCPKNPEIVARKERDNTDKDKSNTNVERKDTPTCISKQGKDDTKSDNQGIEEENQVLSPVHDDKEEHEKSVNDRNNLKTKDSQINEDSDRDSSSEHSITLRHDTPKIVPVIIPRHLPRDYESSRSPSPASSHYDTKRQETDIESSRESIQDPKPDKSNNNKDKWKPAVIVSYAKETNVNYFRNSSADNQQKDTKLTQNSQDENDIESRVQKENTFVVGSELPVETNTDKQEQNSNALNETKDSNDKTEDHMKNKRRKTKCNMISVKPSEHSVDNRLNENQAVETKDSNHKSENNVKDKQSKGRKSKSKSIALQPSFPEEPVDNRHNESKPVGTLRTNSELEPKQTVIPIDDDSRKKKVTITITYAIGLELIFMLFLIAEVGYPVSLMYS